MVYLSLNISLIPSVLTFFFPQVVKLTTFSHQVNWNLSRNAFAVANLLCIYTSFPGDRPALDQLKIIKKHTKHLLCTKCQRAQLATDADLPSFPV